MERLFSILLVASTTTAVRKVVILDDNDWDSISVTSPPVKITNSRFNPKNSTKDNSIGYDHARKNARMMKDCDEGDIKCLYDSELHENGQRNPQDTVDKFIEKYSSVTNVKINEELRNFTSKSYWNQIDSEKHNHPYDDTKGWVTLDPIPWSSSKVSRWKPNNSGSSWMNGPPQHHQSSGPNYWLSNRPQENNRPASNWGVGSNDIITDNNPNGFPLDTSPYPSRPHNSYLSKPTHNLDVSPGYPSPTFSQYHQLNRPYQPFPSSHNPISQHFPPTQNLPPPDSSFPSTQPLLSSANQQPYQWQQNAVDKYGPFNRPQQVNTPVPPAGLPSNYPETGNGEWVLLSTTKGYSVPQRYYDRKMRVQHAIATMPANPDIQSRSSKSKYQENDIDDKYMLLSKLSENNRKSDDFGKMIWNVDGINILETKPDRKQKSIDNSIKDVYKEMIPEKTFRRTVRLTVLPALNNTSTISHDGMLEVDSNPQSVEESQKEHERVKKLQQFAVVNGIQRQLIPVVTPSINNNVINKKRAAVLAAVGAGMIPATMAVLLPVAMGRRKRSLSSLSKINYKKL